MSLSERERHKKQIELFWRLHEGLPKQGPGSDATTRRALALARPIPSEPRMLDFGCGPGRQTLVLAQDLGGHVTAINPLDGATGRKISEVNLSSLHTVRCHSSAGGAAEAL